MYGNLDTAKALIEKWDAATDVTNINDENCLIIAV